MDSDACTGGLALAVWEHIARQSTKKGVRSLDFIVETEMDETAHVLQLSVKILRRLRECQQDESPLEALHGKYCYVYPRLIEHLVTACHASRIGLMGGAMPAAVPDHLKVILFLSIAHDLRIPAKRLSFATLFPASGLVETADKGQMHWWNGVSATCLHISAEPEPLPGATDELSTDVDGIVDDKTAPLPPLATGYELPAEAWWSLVIMMLSKHLEHQHILRKHSSSTSFTRCFFFLLHVNFPLTI
jgi:hypothetical protein